MLGLALCCCFMSGGREPRSRAQPLWDALPFPVPCFSTVCLCGLSQCSSHTDLWLVSSVSPAPSPCCQGNIKHTPRLPASAGAVLFQRCAIWSAKPLHAKQWLLLTSALVSGFQKDSCCFHLHQLSTDSNGGAPSSRGAAAAAGPGTTALELEISKHRFLISS